jgi:hypothetical protein
LWYQQITIKYRDPNNKIYKGYEVVTDIEGAWGTENGEWCYINKVICENKQPTEINKKKKKLKIKPLHKLTNQILMNTNFQVSFQ